jgi:hypothetical protein
MHFLMLIPIQETRDSAAAVLAEERRAIDGRRHRAEDLLLAHAHRKVPFLDGAGPSELDGRTWALGRGFDG